ncbi:MAG: prepilin peptidase [Candidatus Dojkabacteria bacterium]|nr:prepilin peptidase [Candidatus Dojkabacteria bacterium]
MFIIYLCIFFLGASLASFINATLYRIDKGYQYPTIVTKNSFCEKCKKPLSWVQLIPVFGYLIYGGRCKYCKTFVRLYYPISELLLGLSFLLMYLYSIPFYFFIIVIFLFILSYYDSISMSVPRIIVHILLITSILIFFFFQFIPLNIIVPLIIGMFLLLVNVIKKSFGFGDILILFSVGILQTPKQMVCTFWLGVLIALLYSIIIIIRKKIDIKKAKIPMVPFFSVAFVISLIYGEALVEMLLKIFRI